MDDTPGARANTRAACCTIHPKILRSLRKKKDSLYHSYQHVDDTPSGSRIVKIASNKATQSEERLYNQECGLKTVTIATDRITGLRECNPGLTHLYRFTFLWTYLGLKVKSIVQCGLFVGENTVISNSVIE